MEKVEMVIRINQEEHMKDMKEIASSQEHFLAQINSLRQENQ